MKRQSCHHIETSQLICSANQLTGFYLMAFLAFNELNTYRRRMLNIFIKIIHSFIIARKKESWKKLCLILTLEIILL